MISLPTYILLVYLTGGGMRVSATHSLFECLAKSSFEIRYDPSVRTMCVSHEGSWA